MTPAFAGETPKRNLLLLYPDCVLFEITRTCIELQSAGGFTAVSLDDPAALESLDGLLVTPHEKLDTRRIDNVGCFIITGGYPSGIVDHPRWEEFKAFLKALDERDVIIAGICGGVYPLVAAGLLDGQPFTGDRTDFQGHDEVFLKGEYREATLVVSGNVITANSNGDIELAVELARRLGAYASDGEREASYQYHKNTDPVIIRQ